MGNITKIYKLNKIFKAVSTALLEFKNAFVGGKNSDELFASFKGVLNEKLKNYQLICDYVWGQGGAVEGITRDYIPQKGDSLIFDISVEYKGVWCDITRTYYYGEITEDFKNGYALVLSSLRSGETALKEGATAAEIFSAANKVYEKNGAKLVHHAGHRIGAKPVEFPEFTADAVGNGNEIKANAFYAVETGLYENFGIRLENDYIVKNNKAINLSEKFLPLDIEEYLLK